MSALRAELGDMDTIREQQIKPLMLLTWEGVIYIWLVRPHHLFLLTVAAACKYCIVYKSRHQISVIYTRNELERQQYGRSGNQATPSLTSSTSSASFSSQSSVAMVSTMPRFSSVVRTFELTSAKSARIRRTLIKQATRRVSIPQLSPATDRRTMNYFNFGADRL